MAFYDRAPLFMSLVTLYFTTLPIFLYMGIKFAKNGEMEKHRKMQMGLFFLSLAVTLFFEASVRIRGGFLEEIQNSVIPYAFLSKFLIVHIAIASLSLFLWIYIIIKSFVSYKNRENDFFKKRHKIMGKILFLGITLSAIMGLMMYIFLFVEF